MTQSTDEDLLISDTLSFEETDTTAMTTKRAESIVKADNKLNDKNKSGGSKLDQAVNAVKSTFADLKNKIKLPRKINKKLTKVERESINRQRKNVILGIGLLLVIVSIAYSTYVVRTFVDTTESLVYLAPQVVFALIMTFKAFSNLYK